MTDLPVSENRIYRPVALLAAGFFMEGKQKSNLSRFQANKS
ncbi:Uncharacterised protein [Streptococcus sanguinis]|uniref:Uncharacterized protein n=1 Tax=Streptococcus sanguinis TaxID=1305 RepID=A0AAJ5NIE9_STRSA|nr:Uncharacterised protein [Streptococcus sanguinis]